jgi:hypothetical protein
MSLKSYTTVQGLTARIHGLEHELVKANLRLELALVRNNAQEIAECKLDKENVHRKHSWFIHALQRFRVD